ncbi:Ref family protein [Lysobacter sp. GX 14042]|uniref:Ref family recombination enhancement nuclease n=1 Tax=Lysobacter sp. GX 14042 TaxID=2907155 RepID=UPI001F15EB89|nr:Ref family recombination enhancement nuclease [Lysobacter sp. GX 14042]MCE7031757.1 Ref family protein [Lysobacter sp. GX 14042]
MTLARRKGLRSRKRAIPAPTAAQQQYQDRARALGCVVCRFRIEHGMQPNRQPGATEIHHRNVGDLHGQKQLGQDEVVALCEWHHDGDWVHWGWGDDEMREVYGPSFKAHARDFREWTADALPDLPGKGTERWQRYQDELLKGAK